MSTGVTNLGEFDDFIEEAVGEVEESAMQVVLKIGVDLWRKIILKTPVDTGRARQSWNMQWTSPDPSVPPPGSHSEPSVPDPGVPKLGSRLHISSNLHYMPYLEQGDPGPGSDQAPQGMVEVSIQELKSQL